MYSQSQSLQTGNGNTRLIPQGKSIPAQNESRPSSQGFTRKEKDERYVSRFTVHLDYLRVRGELPVEKFEQMMNFICGDRKWIIDDDKPWSVGKNAPWYKNKIETEIAINGGITYQEDGSECHFMIDFSGEYWATREVVAQWRIIRGLATAYDCKCSRIDIAIDDQTFKQIPVKQMVKAWSEGNIFGFRKYQTVGSGTSPEDYQVTRYFGSRNSGKMVRVYNHADECMRFEAEFKRQYADVIFRCLAELERGRITDINDIDIEKLKELNITDLELQITERYIADKEWEITLQRLMAGFALGAIDFRDKSSRQDKSKASVKDTQRLDFYQQFIDKVGMRLRYRIPQKRIPVKEKFDWLVRQVAKTLLVFKKGLGKIQQLEMIEVLYRKAEKRVGARDRLVIDEIFENKEELMDYVRAT